MWIIVCQRDLQLFTLNIWVFFAYIFGQFCSKQVQNFHVRFISLVLFFYFYNGTQFQ